MMLMKINSYEFRFGIMIHAKALEIHFGWFGFMILWSRVK